MSSKEQALAMDRPTKPSMIQRMCINAADRIIKSDRCIPPLARDECYNDRHGSVTVVCISDTHNLQPTLPDGDILIHAGDLSQNGTFDELQAQLTWLSAQPHAHKIVIAGNHDLLLDEDFCSQNPHRDPSEPGKTRDDLDWGSITYLCNSGCTIKVEGRTWKVWGSPLTPQFGAWAFQYPPSNDVWTDVVPKDTNILITHGPPKLYLDNNGKGDANLLTEFRRVRPGLMVFGHIHSGWGSEQIFHNFLHREWEDVKLGRKGLSGVWSMLVSSLVMPMASDLAPWGTRVVNAAITQRGLPNEPQLVKV